MRKHKLQRTMPRQRGFHAQSVTAATERWSGVQENTRVCVFLA